MISEVRDKVKKFIKEIIEAEGEIRVVTVEKNGDGWIAEAEVAEKNQYLTSIKPEYRVFDKSHYIIKLNADLEVTSYKRGERGEEQQEG